MRIYIDLTRTELLERWPESITKNFNKSLHTKLWDRYSRTKHSGHKRVKFVAAVTTLDHNFSYLIAGYLTHLGSGISPAQLLD